MSQVGATGGYLSTLPIKEKKLTLYDLLTAMCATVVAGIGYDAGKRNGFFGVVIGILIGLVIGVSLIAVARKLNRLLFSFCETRKPSLWNELTASMGYLNLLIWAFISAFFTQWVMVYLTACFSLNLRVR
jgi:hypothetical protein